MAATGNNAPNQNNLFEIYKAQVEALSQLRDVVVKAKIDANTAKTIQTSTESIAVSAQAVYDCLAKIAAQDPKSFANADQTISAAIVSLGNIFTLIDGLGTMKFGSVLVAKIRIWRLYRTTYALMKFLWRVGWVNPKIFFMGSLVINAMAQSLGNLITLIGQLGNLPPAFIAKYQIKKLYRVLFGHKPGQPRAKRAVGLYDVYKRLSKGNIIKVIIKGGIAIKFMSSALKDLVGAVNLLGISLPLIILAWFAVKLLNPINNALIHIFKKAGRKMKTIIKGSIVMDFMAGSLLMFVGGMVLVGLIVAGAAKLIGLSLIVIAGIIGMFILIGLAKALINRGVKAIKKIGQAVAILALVAVAMALVASFIVTNIKGFLIVFSFMTLLVGAFFVIGMFSKQIKKGGKSLLLITLCVGLLALIAIGLAFVGQFIIGNVLGILTVMLLMATLVGAAIAIGLLHKKIERGTKAMLAVVIFSAAMALVMLIIAMIASIADPLQMLEVTGIMILIIAAVGAAAWVAGKLYKKLAKGIPAMYAIATICGIMSLVMTGIAVAASIADPLEQLEVAGIMVLLILAVGGIAIAAASFIMGPQAIAFAVGVAAVATISLLCAGIAGVALLMAEAAKAIQETGYSSAEELGAILILPFSALIIGDGKQSLFDVLMQLPGVMDLMVISGKMVNLSSIIYNVGNIADTLQHIASLNMPDPDKGYDEKTGRPLGWKQMTGKDFADAATNTSIILGMSSAMFGDEPTDFTLADGTKFTVQVVDMQGLDKVSFSARMKIRRLSKIVGYVSNMADTLQHIASLNMPDPDAGYNENGKPKGWKQMTSDDFKLASENAGSILTYFASLFADKPVPVTVLGKQITVGARNDMLAGLDNISRSTRRKVDRLGEIVGYVGNMAVTLQNMASLNIPTEFDENGKPKGWIQMGDTEFTKASKNVSEIVTTLISAVSSPDLANQLENMDKDAAKNFATVMGAMSGITGVTDLLKMLAGGEIPTAFINDPETGERVPDPNSYINITKWIKEHPDLSSTVKSMFDVVINAVSPYNHKDDERKLHDAEDEIETLGEVITGIQAPVDTIMNIFKDHLHDPKNASTIKSAWSTLMNTIKDILTTISFTQVNSDKGEDIADIINELNEPINSLLDMYKDKMVEFDADKFKDYYKSIINTPIETVAELGKTYKRSDLKDPLLCFGYIVKKIGEINIDDKSAQNYQTNVKETVGLIKEIGKVDLKKLQTADNLMKHISELSKSIRGDFRELARVLNEELLEALEKLIDIFENPPQHNTAVENTVSLKDATPDKSGTEGQAKKIMDNKNKDNAMADVAKELKSLNKKLANLSKLTFDGEKLKVSSSMWS